MLDAREQRLLEMKADLIGLRLDANETAQLDRALKYIEAQTYDVQYPELRHRRYIPQDGSVPVGADSVLYRQFDEVGTAELISDFADDLPFSDVIQKEFPIPVKPIGSAHKYSYRDLQYAAFSNVAIDAKRAMASRNAIEHKLDTIATFGEAKVGILGLVNNANVDVVGAANVGGNVLWSAKTSPDIVADLGALTSHVVNKTHQIYRPDTILMGTTLFELIKNKPFSTQSDRTVLEWFRENNKDITIDGWYRLDTANAAGTGPRIMAYFKSPLVLQEKIPMEFTLLPPQPKGLAFIVNCWALTAGTHIYQPGACCYMDGAG